MRSANVATRDKIWNLGSRVVKNVRIVLVAVT